MKTLQTWAMGLCLAALAGTILRKLAPENGSGKVFRVLLSAFFICVFLTPFFTAFSFPTELSLDLLPADFEQTVLEDTVAKQLHETVRQAATEVATTALAAQGITAEKIEVVTDNAADGSIYIARVDVTLAPKSRGKRAKAREVLQNRLETTVNVKEAGE